MITEIMNEKYLESGQSDWNGSWTAGIGFDLLLHIVDPLLALSLDFTPFEPKVSVRHLFKASGRVADLLEHGPFDSRLANVDIIVARVLVTRSRTSRTLVARLVKVRLRYEDERLNRDEYLKKTRCVRVPFLFRSAVPSVQDGKANLAIVVQVGIESNRVTARSC